MAPQLVPAVQSPSVPEAPIESMRERRPVAVRVAERAPMPAALLLRPAVQADRRIVELDGMRALAILMVLAVHAGSYDAPKYSLPYFLMLPRQVMWSGVDLFFVLSGFLIGGILLDHKDSPKYYSVFYARRILRIFPVYYALFTSLLVGRWLLPHSDLVAGAMPLWAYPLFLQNTVAPSPTASAWMGPMWSLAVEEQFYLLVPFLIRAVNRRTLVVFCLCCIVLAPVARAVLFAQGAGFEKVSLPCRIDTLAFGVLAAILFTNAAAKQWLSTRSGWLYACLITSAVVSVSYLKWTPSMAATFSYTAMAITYFCFLLVVLLVPIDGLTWLLRSRWMVWVGALSYCVYVIHQPLLFGMFRAFGYVAPAITDLGSVYLTVIALAITFAIAHLSWRYLERPLIQRAHSLYRY